MADYPGITKLSEIDASLPAGSEVASKLDDAVRQIKGFLTTYLAVAHNDTGGIKDSATTLTSIADGLVTYVKMQQASGDVLLGRALTAGVIQEIGCTAFSRTLFAGVDAPAWRGLLDLSALALKATVGTADLDGLSVTAAQLANDAVTTAKIIDAAVTAAKIAGGAVDVGKLGWSGGTDSAPWVMAKGTAAAQMQIGGVLSASVDTSTTPPTLKFSLASVPGPDGSGNAKLFYARVEEQAGSGVAGGASSIGENIRGVATSWAESEDPSDLVGISTSAIVFRKRGVYKLTAYVPGCNGVGKHQAYWGKVAAAGGAFTLSKEGTSSESVAGATSYSIINKIFEVAADGDLYEVRHYTQNAVATDGLGRASANGKQQVYAQVEILKV